jgi:hypothetical protein
MPRLPRQASKWSAAEIKAQAEISAADVLHADQAWMQHTRADARELLHALPDPEQKKPKKKARQ